MGAVDANVPLFNRDTGILKKLMNARVKPGGYLETRGGYEELKPNAGTTANVDANGFIVGLFEHVQSHGAIIGAGNAGATFTTDIAMYGSYFLWKIADDPGGSPPGVGTTSTSNYWAFGSSGKFSRLRTTVAQGAGAGSAFTVIWEYSKGAGVWGALTGPTEDFKTAGTKEISWAIPSDWVPMQVNNIFLYWVRVRILAAGACVADVRILDSQFLSDWPGRVMLFGATAQAAASAALGKLRFYAQNGAGVASWSDAFVGATTLFSGNYPRYRFATFQSRLLFANGLENMRYNNDRASALGLDPPVAPNLQHVAAAAANNYGTAAIYDFAISFGYGPRGEWGESPLVMSTTGPVAYGAGDQAQLTWTGAGAQAGQVERVYLYRTDDLTSVEVSVRNQQPMFRIAALPRLLPNVIQLAYNDFVRQFPFPEFQGDPFTDRVPPARCRFINSAPGRVLYAANDEHPTRGWWSKAGFGETVNKDEDFMDLSDLGGEITGSVWAFDSWFLFTERGMRGASDLNEDIPNIFDVPGGVGSIAPDAVAYRYGQLFWLSGDGVYRMDQSGDIKRISDDQSAVFQKMTIESHGRSRACMYRGMYHVLLMDQNNAPIGSQPAWRYDLVTGNWHEVSHALSPFIDARAPLGHADQGVSHPIFGNQNPLVADRKPYVGEFTTVDAGVGFDVIADIHFGPRGFIKFSPRRFSAYYQSDAGWANPVVSTPPGAAYIFKTPAGFGTPVPKVGTDYKLIVSNLSEKISGAQDITVRFKATTVAGGAVYGQRLIAAYLEGKYLNVHPTS